MCSRLSKAPSLQQSVRGLAEATALAPSPDGDAFAVLHYLVHVQCLPQATALAISPDGDAFAVLHHLVHVLHFIALLCQQLISPVAGVAVGRALQPLGCCWGLVLAPLFFHLQAHKLFRTC